MMKNDNLTPREQLIYNMYLFECEKNERMKSPVWRFKLSWYNLKKRIKNGFGTVN